MTLIFGATSNYFRTIIVKDPVVTIFSLQSHVKAEQVNRSNGDSCPEHLNSCSELIKNQKTVLGLNIVEHPDYCQALVQVRVQALVQTGPQVI